jgi:hypothetical protein
MAKRPRGALQLLLQYGLAVRIPHTNVNAWHSRFKSWLARFRGVASRYLIT